MSHGQIAVARALTRPLVAGEERDGRLVHVYHAPGAVSVRHGNRTVYAWRGQTWDGTDLVFVA